MVKVVKYYSELVDINANCSEKLTDCKGRATVHVCFEDGSGVSVCQSCFETRANDGTWITDNAEILKAS